MKGQEWIGGLFSLLLAGVIAGVALPAILPGQAAKIAPQVDAKEFEIKAISMANSLMGNEKLIAFDQSTNSYKLGMFDVDKLSKVPSEVDADTSFIGISYPKILSFVAFYDENGAARWSFYLKSNDENTNAIINCWKRGLDSPMEECTTRVSEILDSGFPISLKYPDGSVKIGRLKVTVME